MHLQFHSKTLLSMSSLIFLIVLSVLSVYVYSFQSLNGRLKFHSIGVHKFKSQSCIHACTTSTSNDDIRSNDRIFNKIQVEKNDISLGKTGIDRLVCGGCAMSPSLAAGFFNINFGSQNKLPPSTEINTISASNTKQKFLSILQKIFFGVNAKGSLHNFKAGDTRTEISMLINGLSMCAIISIWAFIAYLVQKREEYIELDNMRKEVIKEQQYREVIFAFLPYIY